tara:strand:+ start:440 stop:616 length:177 start_codon:yes stop_codon:yes gene_type:complete
MKYKIGELVLRKEDNALFMVHRKQDETFSGFIGVTCIATGVKLQMNTDYIKSLKTDKK